MAYQAKQNKKAGAKAPAIKAKEAPPVDKMVKAPEETKALATEVKKVEARTVFTATVKDGYAFYVGGKRYLAGESFDVKLTDEVYLSQKWKVTIR